MSFFMIDYIRLKCNHIKYNLITCETTFQRGKVNISSLLLKLSGFLNYISDFAS